MFYEYACRRADELDEMQDELTEAGILSDWMSENEEDAEGVEATQYEEELQQQHHTQSESQPESESDMEEDEVEREEQEEEGDIGGRQ